MKKIIYLFLPFMALSACSTDAIDSEGNDSLDVKTKVQQANDAYDVPALSAGIITETTMEVKITAGATGAEGGFDLQWRLVDNFDSVNWADEDCAAGFASNNNNDYGLGAYGVATLNLEDLIADTGCGTALECGMTYAFRVRAKNEGQGLKKSDWSTDYFFSTADCSSVCTYGPGYWKNHNPLTTPGNQENLWPTNELWLGGVLYSDTEIYSALSAQGGSLVALTRQLIAAKFNVINGATAPEAVDMADEILSNPSNYTNEDIDSVIEALKAFNESSPCDEGSEE